MSWWFLHAQSLALSLVFLAGCTETSADIEPSECPDCPPHQDDPEGWVVGVEERVIYEMNLRAQSSSGDLAGAQSHLDALRELQVNTIWLMPIFPIGEVNSVNSPYSVRDFRDVSEEYGDMEALREFVDAAHARDMAVILDFVANHTAWDHPWMAHPDWYTRDDDGNIVHPPGTNWLDVADLDYDNPEMRDQMIDAMEYWLVEADIDGYRLDAADMIPFDFWQTAIASLEDASDRALLILSEGVRGDHFDAGADLTFGWPFYAALKEVFIQGESATQLGMAHSEEYLEWPQSTHRLRFATNHDESAWDATPVTLFGGLEAATAAHVCATFLGGVPLLYTGQEVGVPGTQPFFSNAPVDWLQNPAMRDDFVNIMTVYAGSDAARSGDLTLYEHADVLNFQRTTDDAALVVFVNSRDQPVTLTLPTPLENTNWVDSIQGTTVNLATSLTLEAYEYRLLQ
jgi:glycosidase